MALFDHEGNVSQFGATDSNIIRYKQAAEYALDAQAYAEAAAESLVAVDADVQKNEAISAYIDEQFERMQDVAAELLLIIAEANEALDTANGMMSYIDDAVAQANQASANATLAAQQSAATSVQASQDAQQATQDAIDTFNSVTADAESVAQTELAEATYDASTTHFHFKIPKGMDGTLQGLSGAPIDTNPDPSDFLILAPANGDPLQKTALSTLLAKIPQKGVRTIGTIEVITDPAFLNNKIVDSVYNNTKLIPDTAPTVGATTDDPTGIQVRVSVGGKLIIQTGQPALDFGVGDYIQWDGTKWIDDRQKVVSVNGKTGTVVLAAADFPDMRSNTENDTRYAAKTTANTFTAANTFSGDTTFSGNVTVQGTGKTLVDFSSSLGRTATPVLSAFDFQTTSLTAGRMAAFNITTASNRPPEFDAVFGTTGAVTFNVITVGVNSNLNEPTVLFRNLAHAALVTFAGASGARTFTVTRLYTSADKPSDTDLGLGTASKKDTNDFVRSESSGIKAGIHNLAVGANIDNLKLETLLGAVVNNPTCVNPIPGHVNNDSYWIQVYVWGAAGTGARVLQLLTKYGVSGNAVGNYYIRSWNGTAWTPWEVSLSADDVIVKNPPTSGLSQTIKGNLLVGAVDATSGGILVVEGGELRLSKQGINAVNVNVSKTTTATNVGVINSNNSNPAASTFGHVGEPMMTFGSTAMNLGFNAKFADIKVRVGAGDAAHTYNIWHDGNPPTMATMNKSNSLLEHVGVRYANAAGGAESWYRIANITGLMQQGMSVGLDFVGNQGYNGTVRNLMRGMITVSTGDGTSATPNTAGRASASMIKFQSGYDPATTSGTITGMVLIETANGVFDLYVKGSPFFGYWSWSVSKSSGGISVTFPNAASDVKPGTQPPTPNVLACEVFPVGNNSPALIYGTNGNSVWTIWRYPNGQQKLVGKLTGFPIPTASENPSGHGNGIRDWALTVPVGYDFIEEPAVQLTVNGGNSNAWKAGLENVTVNRANGFVFSTTTTATNATFYITMEGKWK